MLGMLYFILFFSMWLNTPALKDPLEKKLIARSEQEKTQSEPGVFLKNLLFGNNSKLTKSRKNENRTRNTYICFTQIHLVCS